MLVRWSNFDEWGLYRFYNLGHEGYPDRLPPPPNPDKLQRFFAQCVEQIIIDKNKENSPKPQEREENPGFRRRMTP